QKAGRPHDNGLHCKEKGLTPSSTPARDGTRRLRYRFLELRRLRYFIAVGETLHFGRAAERLGIAQPPLSQQIRRLEEELGVRLLQRTSRHVDLTDAGRLFLVEARRTLAQADRAARIARRTGRGKSGRLAIGYMASAELSVFPKILPAFRKRHPGVQI